MALKAGYVGVKKSFVGLIKSLATSVIIKEVGDGLEYDSDTGELSSTGGGYNYSTTEVSTGQKWVDGKDIYSLVIGLESPVSVPSTQGDITVPGLPAIDTLLDAVFYRTSDKWCVRGGCAYSGTNKLIPRVPNGLTNCNMIQLTYTKQTS